MNALVTGSSSGVGFATAKALLEAGADVILVSRDEKRAQAAVKSLTSASPGRATLELADLGSFDSVRDLARRVEDHVDQLDVLVNNAGIYRPLRALSPDGYELTMAVNHLGHYLLTRLLEPLWADRGAAIVNVSSDGHRAGDLRRAPLEDIMRGTVRYRAMKAYGDSKLANVLFALELRRRYASLGLEAAALHPGVLATRIWNRHLDPISLFMRLLKPVLGRPRTGGDAVMNAVRLAREGESLPLYFDKRKPAEPTPQAMDEALARELWDYSEQATGLT